MWDYDAVSGRAFRAAGPLLFAFCFWGCSRSAPEPEPLQQIGTALRDGEFVRARELVELIPESSKEWAEAQLALGAAATRAGRPQDALPHYLALSRRGERPGDAVAGHFYAAEIYRELGRLAKAEEAYHAVLEIKPDNAATHERLAFLLSVTGRRWESRPHYGFLARSGTAEARELMALADLDRPVEHREYLEECLRKAPDDPLVRFGLAVFTVWEKQSIESAGVLRSALEKTPDQFSGQAFLGELLAYESDREFIKWHDRLPPEASDHPEIWYVRGLWARRHGRARVAARCFWEAVGLDPTHRRANYHLGQVLVSLNHPGGKDFAERAQQLIRLVEILDDMLRSKFQSEGPFRETTELLEQMGRIIEAAAWALAAQREFPAVQWPQGVFDRLQGTLRDDLALTVESANLALRHDLSAFPDHRELLREVRGRESETAEPISFASIRFIEQAAEAGIDFAYHSSPDPSTRGLRMFEQTGGGVAVLDFDLDGLPDLYFTQGAEWPSGAEMAAPSESYVDCLYRNSGAGFADVTREAGAGDRGFGQGCAAGDVNNDGFPDLYVANIGRNRLYINNGDGSFSDASEDSGLTGKSWTASCAIVDLNADGAPDLFDATYLAGDDIYTRICKGRACSPSVFSGAPDRLYVSRGDGTFEPLLVDAAVENSKGLGVLAAVLHEGETPSLFVANDQVANFLLRATSSDARTGIRLEDQAFLSGLAFNEEGMALACMGITADDIDGNGLVDFFVTNFYREFNTLYLQEAPGLFVDVTKRSGLGAPSWPFVGWGTQFLDADLDGEPDLVVANGHVDDYRDEGGEYHMRPQFFRNTGGGRFVELFAEDVGEYFGRKYLGRGLARLDWNRDGRMDFVVSNIGEQASLVTNESTGTGHFLNIRLHATRTARDAIGTVVEVKTEDRQWTKQLVAGDGYMASNERVLQFGLGEAEAVKEVRVSWPSGETAVLQDVPVDATLQLIEGSPRVIRW